MVYDDKFTSVNNPEGLGLVNPTRFDADHWEQIIETGYEMFLDPDEPELPDLDDSWLTPHERQLRLTRRTERRARQAAPQRQPQPQQQQQPTQTPDVCPEGDIRLEGARIRSERRTNENLEVRVRFEDKTRGAGWHEVEEAAPRGVPQRDLDDLSIADNDTQDFDDRILDIDPDVPAPREDNDFGRGTESPRRSQRTMRQPTRMRADRFGEWANYTERRYTQRSRTGLSDAAFVQGLQWTELVDSLRCGAKGIYGSIIRQMERDHDLGTVESWHPLAFATKMDAASAADNPTWEKAMSGPDSDGYMRSAEVEIDTLVEKETWEEVDRESWMNVLPSTWAFKCKRYPDGTIRKFKGRFCVRGDRQIEGVDYFETFAPVVNWTTVRLLLVMSIVLGLATTQADYTAAFVQSPIDRDPNWENMTETERKRSGVYVEMPRGFRVPGKVLKLKRSLYGLRQSPRNFFQHLKGKLEETGFKAMTDVDPCLFISDKVICLSYVDDTLWFSPRQEYIDEALEKLRAVGMDLEKEDDVAGFLGVHLERQGDSIKMTQKGLTGRIIEALGVRDTRTSHTPAKEPLGMDPDGDPPNGNYSYASVIGMLQYLQAHS
jgi:hypothetical protein